MPPAFFAFVLSSAVIKNKPVAWPIGFFVSFFGKETYPPLFAAPREKVRRFFFYPSIYVDEAYYPLDFILFSRE